MTPRVVLDTDFLSAFLKIDRLKLVADFFQTATLSIPPAVYSELAETSLLSRLSIEGGTLDLRILPPPAFQLGLLQENSAFSALGAGEQEAIALAVSAQSLLLMNDNRARQVAGKLGVVVFNVPAFLFAAKGSGFLDLAAVDTLVTSLIEKDHYGFRADILARLLS